MEKGVLGEILLKSYIPIWNKKLCVFFNKKKNITYQNDLKKKNIPLREASDTSSRLTKTNIMEVKEIVVHDKYKVQVSLCIDRFPLNFVEEEFEKDFEDFKDKWLLRTNNNLEVNEEFLHMKYNLSSFHDKINEDNTEENNIENNKKYEKKDIKLEKEHNKDEEKKAEKEDLENLFSIEGIQNILIEKEKKKTKQKDVSDNINEKIKKKEDNNTNEYYYRDIKRKPNNFLYLIVKYKKTNKWMFPVIDFKKKLTIRQNLQYLCSEHLKCEMPCFIGYCPCTFDKRKFKFPILHNEIIGRKIFYYRAHYINNDINLDISQNEYINDFAWMSRSELKNFLSVNKYHVIKDAIPLT
ncbi:mitochondrial ribosomal protein L46 precursor, putative [Plasmodium malariae]|nr:mitochondrial ribosomal protein L46 precursor, putative [Plasmodium malariae]SCO93116.1 mitochondrial ribosomal protein L46 precursor, putative [Plasmodium malariae]